jgi:hypothetical protein
MLRFFHWQGLAGIAAALVLTVMLTVQKLDAVHWKKESERFEQLYHHEQAAFAVTIAKAHTAADAARAADKANADRVAAEQRNINERIANDFEARLAAARAAADRLRVDTQGAAAPGVVRDPPVPGLPATAGSANQGAGQDRLPQSDALTATEQAIQLDELIKWVRQQNAVRVDADDRPAPPGLQQ